MSIGVTFDSASGELTASRLAPSVDQQSIISSHETLWHQFVDQHETPPKEIDLDFDGTDAPPR
jgi:hypothetical protein